MTTLEQLQQLNIDPPKYSPFVLGQNRTICPECSTDRKKSEERCLSVTIEEDGALFLCHHCGYSGRVGAIISTRKTNFTKPDYVASDSLEEVVSSYFKGRGITDEVLLRNRVGYVQTYMPQESGEVGALTFPYFRGDEVINVKYRTLNKSFKMERGAELCLYGENDISGNTLIFVEGEIDKLSAEVAGITSCVSVPNGAPGENTKTFDNHLSYLATTPQLENITRFVIATDNDAPGRALKAELIRRLGPERCWSVEWPEGIKDANEMLVKHGADALNDFLSNPTPVPVAGIVDADSVLEEVLDIYDNGHQPGENPGTVGLGQFYTVKPGQITIVTGIPSHGKSAWVDWVMYSLAAQSGWTFGICSPENQPISEHVIKLIELCSGQSFWRGAEQRLTKDQAAIYGKWVNDMFSFISLDDNVKDWSISGVLDIAKTLVLRKGIRGLVLDPWNEFDHTRTQGLSETEHISRSLCEIKAFARNYGVHVWVVAHPHKLTKLEDGTYPIPNLYQINGSANWYNKADVGIAIWRNPYPIDGYVDPLVKVDIQKVRFKRCGQVGTHAMTYDNSNNRYSDISEEAA
jgi:twinkle protein